LIFVMGDVFPIDIDLLMGAITLILFSLKMIQRYFW